MQRHWTAWVTLLASLVTHHSLIAAEWRPYSNPNGEFKIEFPAAPHEAVQSIETAKGRVPYTTLTSEISNGNVAYGLAWHDFPPESDLKNVKSLLDASRDGPRNNLNGKVVSEIEMTYQGHPGREFTVIGEIDGKPLFCHMRVFLIGRRLYQLQIVRVGETPIDLADAVRYFASFTPRLQ